MWRLSMTRGDTPTIKARTFAPDGEETDLTGSSVTFRAAHTSTSAPIIVKTEADGIDIFPGYMNIQLEPEDTTQLSNAFATVLVWDIEVIDGMDIETIADGTLLIKPSIG
jgi:hypothetical protein